MALDWALLTRFNETEAVSVEQDQPASTLYSPRNRSMVVNSREMVRLLLIAVSFQGPTLFVEKRVCAVFFFFFLFIFVD